MVWPINQHDQFVVGLAEGKVRGCMLKSNKSQPLFGTESFCVSIAASPDGNNIAAGFLDNTILTFNLETKVKTKMTHSTIP
jgi:intraflagellar transport protein 172